MKKNNKFSWSTVEILIVIAFVGLLVFLLIDPLNTRPHKVRMRNSLGLEVIRINSRSGQEEKNISYADFNGYHIDLVFEPALSIVGLRVNWYEVKEDDGVSVFDFVRSEAKILSSGTNLFSGPKGTFYISGGTTNLPVMHLKEGKDLFLFVPIGKAYIENGSNVVSRSKPGAED